MANNDTQNVNTHSGYSILNILLQVLSQVNKPIEIIYADIIAYQSPAHSC